ncbi:Probable phosphorylase b kinase regulatory subunit alpha [Lepeophtheirus salmonis]|uniref:Phosphorylase b kinase regulatory subunit n=1 Tax=Lepeophtheirus salmonis TaxID=72036 RepID=A0A7R8CYL0_LEPSM|nr:Probable phosphorylase b kinase regulatory subunit alpha [Lepeophtheirus salmonis]CAF2942393.1 Probable phosphorylase b kinase regulatory subunit alpha [Lepeophtheirus salmonis]
MFKAFKGDASTAMLANELLCYLAMFINTDPHIFHGIMRIRIGLIIQVLASEMGDKLDLSKDDAYEQLMSLSPFDMRNILLNVMASKDFHIDKIESGWSINTLDETKLSQALLKSSFKEEYKEKLIKANQNGQTTNNSVDSDDTDDNDEEEGAWVRRRRLDGALNRVPTGFYSKIWHLLRVCRELHIGTEKYLSTSVTQEMTKYRQLLVEVLMVLIMAQERRITKSLDDSIDLDKIVHLANELFLIDQRKIQGDAMQCCAKEDQNHDAPLCGGAGKICQIFYDTAPSGPYGTMQYMIHAACQLLDQIPKDGEISCNKLRLGSKLADAHFKMSKLGARMKIKYATQVFSSSVAAALVTDANLGVLHITANKTADFCQQVKDLFDVCFTTLSTFEMSSTMDVEKLSLPKLDEEIKNLAQGKEVDTLFHIYEHLLTSPLGEENTNVTQWTGFTVDDQTFALSKPTDTVDPIYGDPVTQKLILGAQVSNGKVNHEDPAISGEGLKIKMLNGKEINLVKKDGKLMANDMPVKNILTFVKELIGYRRRKVLFILHGDLTHMRKNDS